MAGMNAGADDEIRPAALTLARDAVECYVRTGRLPDPPPDLPEALREPRAAFVTLRANGRLRGCVGTLVPSQPDLGGEIISSAVSAATRDSRFLPIRSDELPSLAYEVDIVEQLEAAQGPEDLDPNTYGIVVEADGRRGVLLPDLAGVDTIEQQLAIARIKAGLAADARVTLYRFRVRRYADPA